MKRWIFSVGWVLLGLLGISAVLISAGRHDQKVNPASSSYGVSGSSALADLLRLRGYKVVVDGHEKPKIGQDDVIIAFQSSDASSLQDPAQVQRTTDSIEAQVKQGATVFWLPLTPDFEQMSADNQLAQTYRRPDHQSRVLTGSPLSSFQGSSFQGPENAVPLLSNHSDLFIYADSLGKGSEIWYGDGMGLTNRFLDQADNAKVFAEILRAYAPHAKTVVFAEAAFGVVQEEGFLETLGPWAEGSWYQILFVFFIIATTLNQRFGLPIRLRRVQLGGRELVDALGDTMLRAKATDVGLESAYERADKRIRSTIRMPRDASEGERDRLLPEDILIQLAEVRAASKMDRVHPKDAVDLVMRLEKSVDEFAHSQGNLMVKPKNRKH